MKGRRVCMASIIAQCQWIKTWISQHNISVITLYRQVLRPHSSYVQRWPTCRNTDIVNCANRNYLPLVRCWCAEITGEMWTCRRSSTSWPSWWTKRRKAHSLRSWPMVESASCGSNTITSTVSCLIPPWFTHLNICIVCLFLDYESSLHFLTHIISVVATSKKNASVSLVFSFLYKIVQVWIKFFLINNTNWQLWINRFLNSVLMFSRFSQSISKNWRRRASEITLSSFMSWWMSWWTLAILRPLTARSCKSEFFFN